MKHTHILNIGYPKCGTTWCWEQLSQQPWFDMPREKENKDLLKGNRSVDQYVADYNKHNITANFNPTNFAADRYIISLLSQVPSISTSIILRNPYELYWSMYNYMPNHNNFSFDEYTNNLLEQTWFNRVDMILSRWMEFFSPARFKIFFYQDLRADSQLFFNNYCKTMKLPDLIFCEPHEVNVTSYKKTIPDTLPAELVAKINNDIDKLQPLLDRDISHWKQ